MVAAAAALLGFYAYSQVRPPIDFGIFLSPPIYGYWRPVLDPLALSVVPAGLALGAVGWLSVATKRLPTWAALGLTVVVGVATAGSVALVRGEPFDLIRSVVLEPEPRQYVADLHFVYEYGIRGFAERHAELVPAFQFFPSTTHPPGVHIFLYLLFRLFGADQSLWISTAMAFVALCAAVAAWSMARTMGGPRAGRIAAVLFAAAPGPLMLAYTNVDVVFATLMATSVALFMIAARKLSVTSAATGGVVLGLCTLMTYATVFVALAATTAVVVQTRRVREAARLLGAAAAGGLAVLVLARLALGLDVLSAYSSLARPIREYDPYWIAASPAAWLMYAGLPLAGLGVVGLARRARGEPRHVLPLVLVVIMVVWASLPPEITKLRPGEVERSWAFLYPVVAAGAALVVDRWSRAFGRWSGAIVAGLVIISVAQAVLVQSLWENLF
jgi:4-amino-4-deoxy-L-arabinose transferase-like glycosyltransferase